MTTLDDALTAPAATTEARAERIVAAAHPKRRGIVALLIGWLSVIVGDIRGAWVWSAAPPALREIWATRGVSPDDIPGRYHRCQGPPVVVSRWNVFTRAYRTVTCTCPRFEMPDADPKILRQARIDANRIKRAPMYLRLAWLLFNHLVMVPVTVAAYIVAWTHQNPARALLFWALIAPFWLLAH